MKNLFTEHVIVSTANVRIIWDGENKWVPGNIYLFYCYISLEVITIKQLYEFSFV